MAACGLGRFRGRRGRTTAVCLMLVVPLGLLAGVTMWPWTIAPPPPPREPGVVYLADYGHHSRLALQVDRQRMVEYAFGDWRYFAAGENTLWRGTVALFVPTEATLGRRPLASVPDEAAFNDLTGAVRSLRIEVERARLEELLAVLEGRYGAQVSTEVAGEWTEMTFVKERGPYHLFQNSNHQTANWLRALGCEVGRFPIRSNFRLRPGREPVERPLPTCKS